MSDIEPSILFGQKADPKFGLIARGWDHYRDIMTKCSELIESKGFPPLGSRVEVHAEGKEWKYAKRDMRAEYEGLEVYENGTQTAEQFIRSQSRVTDDINYALMIAERCAFILRVENKPDRFDFSHYAAMHEIGELTVEAYWRKAFKADIVRGISTLQAARLGGAQRKKRLGDKSADIIKQMAALVDAGRGVNEAAAICFRRGIGKSAGANRALWYRRLKNV
jgi:hypothetical protein